MDKRAVPFTVGEALNENGEIFLGINERGGVGDTENTISITVLNKNNDILKGTFTGSVRSAGELPIIINDGRFRIQLSRYQENIKLDSCEAKAGSDTVLYPTKEDPALFAGAVNSDSIVWVGDGCNIHYFRNAFSTHEVLFNNQKEYQPATMGILIRSPKNVIENRTIIDSVFNAHEPGVKKLALNPGENGFTIEMYLTDTQGNISIFSTFAVEQIEKDFEITSRSGIQRPGNGFPWFYLSGGQTAFISCAPWKIPKMNKADLRELVILFKYLNAI